MSFWDLSSGQQAAQTTELDQSTDIEPIPSGTCLKSVCTEAKIDEYEGERKIKLRWDVIDGEYKDRVVFQSLKTFDSDNKKRDRAIEMLAALDMICSRGKLMASGQEPTDMSLMQNLCNKPVTIRVQEWEMNGKKGNWVDGVWGGAAPKPKAEQAAKAAPGVGDNFDDDIPF